MLILYRHRSMFIQFLAGYSFGHKIISVGQTVDTLYLTHINEQLPKNNFGECKNEGILL
jgi:hypothetical protein